MVLQADEIPLVVVRLSFQNDGIVLSVELIINLEITCFEG